MTAPDPNPQAATGNPSLASIQAHMIELQGMIEGIDPTNQPKESTPGLPILSDIHLDTLQLQGLIDALDLLQELGGAQSAPIWAVVTCAKPLARKISSDLERVM